MSAETPDHNPYQFTVDFDGLTEAPVDGLRLVSDAQSAVTAAEFDLAQTGLDKSHNTAMLRHKAFSMIPRLSRAAGLGYATELFEKDETEKREENIWCYARTESDQRLVLGKHRLVAGVVAGHFGFARTAAGYYEQAGYSPLHVLHVVAEDLESQVHDDQTLNELIAWGIDKDQTTRKPVVATKLLRVIAEEITDPVVALQAYDTLYRHGDFQSFDSMIYLLEAFIGNIFVEKRQAFTHENACNVVTWLNELGRYVLMVDPQNIGRQRSDRVTNLTQRVNVASKTPNTGVGIGRVLGYMSVGRR